MHTPTVLTIAGFDPYGGAGIQVDTKTIHALGAYALSCVTAITAQNSQGVKAVEAVSSEILRLQLKTLLDDVKVDAVKIGMLADSSLIEVVAETIKMYRLTNVVLDPVFVSSSGKLLLEPEAVEQMIFKLFPLCRLITPNLDETNTLLKSDFKGSARDVSKMAEGLFSLGARNILFKGGHTLEKNAVDYLIELSSRTHLSTPRIETSHTHGTGCLLSSAIAASLAKGETLSDSVKQAKGFLYEKLQKASELKLHYTADAVTRKESVF